MILINTGDFEPDVGWSKKADQLTEQLLSNASDKAKIHAIIDSNERVWRELKTPLLDKSHGKCWYSESRENYSHMHVDHFRPKKVALDIQKIDRGGYWWLAFNWNNYRICGSVGNINKRGKFAVYSHKANSPEDNIEDEIIYFLDPTEEEDVLKITFNCNGEIVPIEKSGFSSKQAKYTIECLKLNCRTLKEARKGIWNSCDRLFRETQKLMKENDTNPSSFKKGQIKEKLRQIKKLVHPTSEFSATAKACLKSTGIDWSMSIAA